MNLTWPSSGAGYIYRLLQLLMSIRDINTDTQELEFQVCMVSV